MWAGDFTVCGSYTRISRAPVIFRLYPWLLFLARRPRMSYCLPIVHPEQPDERSTETTEQSLDLSSTSKRSLALPPLFRLIPLRSSSRPTDRPSNLITRRATHGMLEDQMAYVT